MKLQLHRFHRPARGVTILELMVAISLVSFIILSLYQMFDRTQGLMRGAVRDADKFENGRSAMDILRRDLSQMGFVRTTFDAGVGAVTNWAAPTLPPTTWSAATAYPAGSTVIQAGFPYFAMAPTTNNIPPARPWTFAAPNFRISEFSQQSPTPMVYLGAAGSPLLTNSLHDLFFMYFDPLIRTTVTANGNITPGSSYVASNALTYPLAPLTPTLNYAGGDPFFGQAGGPTYGGGANRAVLVEGGWRAVGYRVASSTNAAVLLGSAGPGPQIGTLYRYELGTLENDSRRMFLAFRFFATLNYAPATNAMQRVAENVVHFRCQAVDGNGSPVQLTPGAGSILMFGTNVPAIVQVELGILDGKVAGQANGIGTTNYLSQQGDAIQIFRQQVAIRLGQQ